MDDQTQQQPMSDDELVALYQQLKTKVTELSTPTLLQRGAHMVESVSAPAALAGLGGLLSFVPHPAAQVAGRGLSMVGALGSAGYTGAGLMRGASALFEPEHGESLLNAGIETGLGALGAGVLGRLRGMAGSIASRVRGPAAPAPETIEQIAQELEQRMARPPAVSPPPSGVGNAAQAIDEALGEGASPADKLGAEIQRMLRERAGRTAPTSPGPSRGRVPTDLVRQSPMTTSTDELVETLNRPEATIEYLPRSKRYTTKEFLKNLTPQEEANMLEGQERLAKHVPKATPAIREELDRMGVEYRRTQDAYVKMREMMAGPVHPDEIAKMDNAARELAARLWKGVQVAKGGGVATGAQLHGAINEALAKAMKDSGFAMNELMQRIAGAGIGAAGGAALGDTPEQRATFALAGGALGAGAPSILSKFGKNPVQALEDVTYFSLLSDPNVMGKAGLGAIGGAVTKAMEMITGGVAAADPQMVQNGGAIIRALLAEGKNVGLDALKGGPLAAAPRSVYFRVMKNPALANAMTHGVPGRVPTGAMGGIGRVMSAGDTAAIMAMRAGGVSAEEAARYTLAGVPTSTAGQEAVALSHGRIPDSMRRLLPKRPLNATERGEFSPVLRGIMTQISPFARTGVQMVERGLLERTPGIAQAVSLSPTARAALSPGASVSDLIARQLVGAGAMYGGYKSEGKVAPQLIPLLAAIAGPNAVPFVIGHELGRANRGGLPDETAITNALETISPVSRSPFAFATQPLQELSSRIVPGAVASVARAIDPAYGRETGPNALLNEQDGLGGMPRNLLERQFARIQSRLPVLRERLPETFRPVDVYGEPRIPAYPFGQPPEGVDRDVMGVLQRFVAPSTGGLPMPPAEDLTDPNLKALHDEGVSLSSPTGRVNLPGTGVQLPLGREAVAAVQKAHGLAQKVAVEVVANDPEIMRLPPGPLKADMIKRRIAEIKSRVIASFGSPLLMAASSEEQ